MLGLDSVFHAPVTFEQIGGRAAAAFGQGLERGEAPDMKIVDRITDSLLIASEGASNRGGMLPFGTR